MMRCCVVGVRGRFLCSRILLSNKELRLRTLNITLVNPRQVLLCVLYCY
jgi:hypothetical protein